MAFETPVQIDEPSAYLSPQPCRTLRGFYNFCATSRFGFCIILPPPLPHPGIALHPSPPPHSRVRVAKEEGTCLHPMQSLHNGEAIAICIGYFDNLRTIKYLPKV